MRSAESRGPWPAAAPGLGGLRWPAGGAVISAAAQRDGFIRLSRRPRTIPGLRRCNLSPASRQLTAAYRGVSPSAHRFPRGSLFKFTSGGKRRQIPAWRSAPPEGGVRAVSMWSIYTWSWRGGETLRLFPDTLKTKVLKQTVDSSVCQSHASAANDCFH